MGEFRSLIVDHSAEIGGAQLSLLHMATSLEWDVLLLRPGALSSRLHDNGVRVLYATSPRGTSTPIRNSVGWRTLWNIARDGVILRRALKRAIDENDYSVVVINSLRATLLLVGVRFQVRTARFICMVRDGLCPPYLSRVRALFSRLLVHVSAHSIVANSEWTASSLGWSSRVSVVYPFLDQEFFDRPIVVKDNPVARETTPVILCLGRLAAWKGQHIAINAVKALRARGVSAELVVAGGSWFGEEAYGEKLLGLVEAELLSCVTFLGHVDDVIDVIDKSDIVLHTSVFPEPFGQVVAQAMARGRIVIAADSGGPAEIIESGETGLLAAPGDSEELAQSLERLALQRIALQEQDEIRRRAVVRAQEKFHPALQADKILSIAREQHAIALNVRRQ